MTERLGIEWACDDRALGRMISLIEAGGDDRRRAVSAVRGLPRSAHVVGVTGPPGAGKSSLSARIAKRLTTDGARAAVVAVDPTSPFTGGALLGDRVRMSELEDEAGVFVRSMASRRHAGGIARATGDVVDLLAAMGFAYVLVETVGTGQGEVAVADLADTIAVVSVPGLGDHVQAEKAGMLEIAHIHVVNKADLPGADRVATELSTTVHLGAASEWSAPVVLTSCVDDSGVDGLVDALESHRAHLTETGELEARRIKMMERRLLDGAQAQWADNLLRHPGMDMVTELARRIVVDEFDVERGVATLVASSSTPPPVERRDPPSSG